MNIYPLHSPPLRFTRGELVSPDQAERVHALAKNILREIGLEICDERILERLAGFGLRQVGKRVFFSPEMVEEYVAEMRRLVTGWQAGASSAGAPVDDGRLTMNASSYPMYVHDLDSGKAVPFDSDRLIDMTKLIDSLAGEGVGGAPPGIPMDVDPDLQPLAQYRIAALYARQGATPVDPTSPRTARAMLDMAEVMGSPMRSLPVYIPTPLRFGGESLEVVLACLDRLDHIAVSSMPAAGTTAPIHPFGALALGAAELIGGMIVVKLLTGKPVTFRVGLFPTDLREGSMVFGSPENMLFQMVESDLNRFYGWQDDGAPGNFHVMAKLPGCQSAAEKAAIMATGAFLGARHFSCAGTLSLDEIFSPEQLLVDCEIRDWVERGLRGVWMGEEAVTDWLEEIRAGIQGGFMGRDSTLDTYRTHIWYPRWFARGAIGPWLEQGQPDPSARLKGEVKRRIAAHDFSLPPEKRRAVEEIYRAAEGSIR